MINPSHCRYAEDVNGAFPAEIMRRPGGEGIRDCIQCGTCSAGCPMSVYMDYTPRRIVCLARAGLEKDVLTSFTPWLCASCYECQVMCPKGIKVTDVMYAIKRLAIERGSYPRRFPVPILAREFFDLVARNGRSTESLLVIKLMLRTNPLKMLKMAPQGWKLWRRGRMPMGLEKIAGRQQLHAILGSVEER